MEPILGMAAAAATVAAASLGVVALSDSDVSDPSHGTTASEMREVAAEWPTVPLFLPVDLPGDYGWAGVGRLEAGGDGQVISRSVQFTSVDARPLVEICVAVTDEATGCEVDGDPSVKRRLLGYDVVITFESEAPTEASASLRQFWETVDLSIDVDDTNWILP